MFSFAKGEPRNQKLSFTSVHSSKSDETSSFFQISESIIIESDSLIRPRPAPIYMRIGSPTTYCVVTIRPLDIASKASSDISRRRNEKKLVYAEFSHWLASDSRSYALTGGDIYTVFLTSPHNVDFQGFRSKIKPDSQKFSL